MLAAACLLPWPSAAAQFTASAYVSAALSASPAMRAAEESFRQAEAVYMASVFDAAFPSFNFTMGESFYDDLDPRLRVARSAVTSGLSASWRLYDSASSPLLKIKKAGLDYETAELTLLSAKQREAIIALTRFYSLYSAQQRTVIAKMNLASRERQYKDTYEQFNSGTQGRIQVTQSEGDKLQSELDLAQAEADETKALMAFNELLNAGPDAAEQVEVSTQPPDIKLPLPRSDADRALKNNFSIRSQRLALEKARLQRHSDVASYYPRLSLDASWSKTGLGLVGPGYSGAGNPSYGLAATLNFPFGFFGVQNRVRKREADSVLRSAELALEDSERTLKTSVLSSQSDIALQVKSRQLLDFQVKAQKETLDNVQSEYALGGVDFLQLDSSQTKLLDASNSLVSAIDDLQLALANYRALLGEKIWE